MGTDYIIVSPHHKRVWKTHKTRGEVLLELATGRGRAPPTCFESSPYFDPEYALRYFEQLITREMILQTEVIRRYTGYGYDYASWEWGPLIEAVATVLDDPEHFITADRSDAYFMYREPSYDLQLSRIKQHLPNPHLRDGWAQIE